MREIASSRQRTFFRIKRKPKIVYLTGDRHHDQMYGDYGHIRDTVISLEKVFENQAYLAHNHWVGVCRITYVNDWEELGIRAGDFDQFVVDTAAGKDDAEEKMKRALLDDLEHSGIDID